MGDFPKKIQLETHDTCDIKDGHANGSLSVVYRDWDNIIDFTPKMLYVTSINKGEIKGPHIHLRRNSYFVCIKGEVVFIIKDNDRYLEFRSKETSPAMIYVPKNFASAHINLDNHTSSVLAIGDIAWRPNDNEMKNVSFDDYDWNKWDTDVQRIK